MKHIVVNKGSFYGHSFFIGTGNRATNYCETKQ